MAENFKSKKIGVKALCRISAKGGEGIYLYIPKNFSDVYNIVGADYAEITFHKIFYKVEGHPDSDVKDLRSRKKKQEKLEG
jgi:hypothetical protein